MSEEQSSPKPETTKVFYELTKDLLERQIDNARDLDAKMLQIFSAATIAAGLAGFSAAGLRPLGEEWAVATLLSFAFVAYAATAYVAFRHLAPRRWKRLNYRGFWEEGWHLHPNELQHSIVAKALKNHSANQSMLDSKAVTITYALATTAAQILLTGLALISALAA